MILDKEYHIKLYHLKLENMQHAVLADHVPKTVKGSVNSHKL